MTLRRWFVLAPAATIVAWLALAGPAAAAAAAADVQLHAWTTVRLQRMAQHATCTLTWYPSSERQHGAVRRAA